MNLLEINVPGRNPFCLYIYVFLANQQMFLGPGVLDPCPPETDDCVFFLGIQILVHTDSRCLLKSKVRLFCTHTQGRN